MKLDLSGRVVVVSGASGGIGRSIALSLAAEGARLGIGARREKDLERVGAEIKDLGAEVVTAAGDLSDPSTVDRLVTTTTVAFGGVDGVAACVGSTPLGTFGELAD